MKKLFPKNAPIQFPTLPKAIIKYHSLTPIGNPRTILNRSRGIHYSFLDLRHLLS
ncbi:MAG: hypothetical protein MJ202_01460 [Lentisphaeria bacterium]|nr:hypothetical protein [Lentisphaeria bacterium]